MLLAHTKVLAMTSMRRSVPCCDLGRVRNARKAIPEAASHSAHDRSRIFSVQSRNSIRNDAWRLSLIATLLVASMLLLLYRSRACWRWPVPVATGALAVFGSERGLRRSARHYSRFGVTLIGEGVDYAIYLFTQIDHNEIPQHTLRRIWPTLRLVC